MVDFDKLVTAKAMDAFAEDVLFAPVEGDETPGRGSFNEEFLAVGLGSEGLPVSSVHPALDVRLSELGFTPRQGDGVTVRGASYSVIEVQRDGIGGATLVLQET